MGAVFESSHGEVRGCVPDGRLVGNAGGARVPEPPATDNLLMAAALAKGTTVIENAAKEPEVSHLAALCAPWGPTCAAGHHALRSRGRRAASARHAVVADRVVAVTISPPWPWPGAR